MNIEHQLRVVESRVRSVKRRLARGNHGDATRAITKAIRHLTRALLMTNRVYETEKRGRHGE